MLAYSIKPILALIPESYDMIKKASVEEDFPTDSKDSVIASALQLSYMTKIAKTYVDPDISQKVKDAVTMYQVQEEVEALSNQMTKAASFNEAESRRDKKAEYIEKQAMFDGSLCLSFDPLSKASEAQQLWKEAQALKLDSAESVQRYSGHMYLDKQAAIDSLSTRAYLSGSDAFTKIAEFIESVEPLYMPQELVAAFCHDVSLMDKEAGLHMRGFNIYKEALRTPEMVKKALNIKLCNKDVPYEKFAMLGRDRMAHYVGEDIAKELDTSPVHFKQAAEALPKDLQQIMYNMSKNV